MLTKFTAGVMAATFMALAAPALADDIKTPVFSVNATEDEDSSACPQDKTIGELTEEEKKLCFATEEEEEEDKEEEFVIRLHNKVDAPSAQKVIVALREYAEQDPEREIIFYINSLGGSLTQGLAIYDTMQDIPNNIRTICEGADMSAGLLLLAAGTPGKRQSLPNCDIMAHQASGGVAGHIEDSRIGVEFQTKQNERAISIIAAHSGWDAVTLTEIISHNLYITPEQAQDMGFIDSIIEPTKPLPQTPVRTAADLPEWLCEGERAQVVTACVVQRHLNNN